MLYIFDYDGTLRSISFEGIYYGYQAIISEIIGKDPQDFFSNFKEFKEWFNPYWPHNLEKIGIADYQNNLKRIDAVFRKQYAEHTYIFPWVDTILAVISKNEGNLLTICSTACSLVIKNELGKLAAFFSLIIGSDNVNFIKPNPEGIRLILEQTNEFPKNAIIIGDTEDDILAGKAAGIKTGAVIWGLNKEKDLIDLKPDYIFRSAKNLLDLIHLE